MGRILDLQGDPYVRAVLREHPERNPFTPPKPNPNPPPAPSPSEMALEKERRIDALCAELESLCASSDPFIAIKIAKAVAKAHGITFRELISQRRTSHLVRARQHAMYEMRENTTLSLPHIGRLLGDRDHTTILYGIRQHERRMMGEVK